MILVAMNGPTQSQIANPDEYLNGYSTYAYDYGFDYNSAWKARSPKADDDFKTWCQSWDIAKKFREEKYKSNSQSFIAFWFYEGILYQMEWIDRTWPTDNEIWIWKFDDFTDIYDGGEPPIVVTKVIPSTAQQIREMVATWYNVLKEFSLVGLLSALVYIAIRMIASSVASQKAKYKKMLMGWFEAVCILLVLHFIISLSFALVESITDAFAGSVIGPEGEDAIVSEIRNNIENGTDTFFNTIIYLVIFIYTLSFSVQYLKRVIYVAFLTLISPLIALTYPLDKIKDGRAQAFEVWMKEFAFNLLIQPVHLILYNMLVINATELVKINKIYALVAIGSLLPAEKFIRKMFGLESSESSGKMASALGGAAIMNSMNKIGNKAPGGKPGGNSGGAPSGGGEKTKIRKPNSGFDAYSALRSSVGENNENEQEQSTENVHMAGGNTQNSVQNTVASSPRANNSATSKKSGTPATQNTTRTATTTPQTGTSTTGTKGATTQTGKGATTQKAGGTNTAGEKGNLKNSAGTKKGKWKARGNGILKLIGKYGKNGIRGAMRVAGATTLGTIGLAAGIATGDMSNAFAGLAGGITAGSKLGASAVDGVANLGKGVVGFGKGVADTYRTGAYGESEAKKIRERKDFMKTADYKTLMKDHEGQEKTVEKLFSEGIRDTKKMDKAMKNVEAGKYSLDEAIAYMKMAEKCPDKIFYSEIKFKQYLTSYGLSEEQADEIRKEVITFK